jgi:hypothetical protein
MSASNCVELKTGVAVTKEGKGSGYAATLGAGLGVSLNSAVTGHWIQQPRLIRSVEWKARIVH